MKEYLRLLPFCKTIHGQSPMVSWVTYLLRLRPKERRATRPLDAEEAVRSAQRHLKAEMAAHRATAMEARRGLAKDNRRRLRVLAGGK